MESNGLKLANPWFHTFISPYTTQVTPSTRLFPRPTTVHGCTRPARAVRLTAVAGQSTDDPRRQQTRGHHGGTRPQQFSPRPPSLRFCVIAVVCLYCLCLFLCRSLSEELSRSTLCAQSLLCAHCAILLVVSPLSLKGARRLSQSRLDH